MNDLKHALEESHKDLKQWFIMHQECLLLSEDNYAKDAFNGFSALLILHIQFENDWLLNHDCFHSNDKHSLRWSLKVYHKEHEKLLSMLKKLSNMLDSYYPLNGRIKRLALLEILDFQSSFLHVMEHHEEREEQDLFENLPDDKPLLQYWLDCETQFLPHHQSKKQLKTFLAG